MLISITLLRMWRSLLGKESFQRLGAKREQRGMVSCYRWMIPLPRTAIDFGGSPWLIWNVTFAREMIGEIPSEMFFHFFKSFSDSAKCNLNIKADGDNDHHKIEAIFKAFAKSSKNGCKKDR